MSISTPNAISTPNTSPTITTDALIIGFGKGGKTLAAKLSAAGRKVVVAEASADMYGGTCINIGCLPSKSLILSAEQARRDGANSTPETREAAFEAAIKEKRRVTSMLRDKNYHKLADQDNITVITGRAHFTGPHSVEIATAEGPIAVTASKIFINTGATPRIPDIPGIRTTPGVYTSTGLMDLDDMPQRLVIIGSGFIGLEFASMFADFGTAVTVLQHNAEFLPREDADVAAAIRAQLEAQGVKFLFNADTKAIAAHRKLAIPPPPAPGTLIPISPAPPTLQQPPAPLATRPITPRCHTFKRNHQTMASRGSPSRLKPDSA